MQFRMLSQLRKAKEIGMENKPKAEHSGHLPQYRPKRTIKYHHLPLERRKDYGTYQFV